MAYNHACRFLACPNRYVALVQVNARKDARILALERTNAQWQRRDAQWERRDAAQQRKIADLERMIAQEQREKKHVQQDEAVLLMKTAELKVCLAEVPAHAQIRQC